MVAGVLLTMRLIALERLLRPFRGRPIALSLARQLVLERAARPARLGQQDVHRFSNLAEELRRCGPKGIPRQRLST